MSLNPHLRKDANGNWWLNWDADPKAVVYDIVTPNGSHVQAGKAKANPGPGVKFGKPAQPFTVQIAAAYAQAYESVSQPPVAPPPPPTAGVFVSTTGDDTTGNGSLLKPFKTLVRAQKAMRLGGPQTCYSRGGTYQVPVAETLSGSTFGLRCTAQDSGQTYMPFENEPVALDCSALRNGLVADGASHVTFDGFEVFGAKWVGIGIHGGGNGLQMFPQTVGEARGNTVRNCHVHDCSSDTSVVYGYGAAPIFGRGNIPDTAIMRNAVHDALTGGITVTAGDGAGPHFIDNLRIAGNAVTKVCQKISDAGGIYWQDVNASSIGISILENFVRDVAGGRSLYADDGACNATVERNIVAGIFDIACMIHGGRMNKWWRNLVDIEAFSTNGPRVTRYQGSSVPTDHQGNEWTNNIIISKAARWEAYWNDFPMLIRDNLYHIYAGAKIDASGDTNPVWADPKLSGLFYTLAPDSPAYQAPVSFLPLPTHSGPPGYVIPAGTAPSYAS